MSLQLFEPFLQTWSWDTSISQACTNHQFGRLPVKWRWRDENVIKKWKLFHVVAGGGTPDVENLCKFSANGQILIEVEVGQLFPAALPTKIFQWKLLQPLFILHLFSILALPPPRQVSCKPFKDSDTVMVPPSHLEMNFSKIGCVHLACFGVLFFCLLAGH